MLSLRIFGVVTVTLITTILMSWEPGTTNSLSITRGHIISQDRQCPSSTPQGAEGAGNSGRPLASVLKMHDLTMIAGDLLDLVDL